MDLIRVADARDPRIARYRGLSDAELIRRDGLFVAEGRLVVERLLLEDRYRVESLLLNEGSLAALRPVLESTASSARVFLCDTAAFEAITGFNIHRGCLGLARRQPELSWRDAVGASRLVVVLEGITNADNVGGIFRNAAAFGAGAVLLSPTACDPLYRKSIRTSMGAALRVPFARLEPWPQALLALRAGGFSVIALSPREPSITLDAFATGHRGTRTALLVGTEGAGLSHAAEAIADLRVRIPISSDVDSLNVSVAAAIALARLSAP
jgi:tRNA G18 (ribose-2'-O)-methylase SpoU